MNEQPKQLTTEPIVKPEAKPYAYAVGNQLFWDRQEAIAAAGKTPVYDLYLRSAFNA